MHADVIIAGAGSVGVPTSMALGEMGVNTLVIDMNASPGQGENKHAIGGVRATHSDAGKILTGQRSLEIFSTWQDQQGDNIEWLKGGYAFPVYRKSDELMLKELLPIQKKHGLNIDFIKPNKIRELIPGINTKGLRGGTFAPDDGSISPLLSVNAFYKKALNRGVQFRFKEKINKILCKNGKVFGVKTNQTTYKTPVVIDAAGPFSAQLCKSVEVELPVIPDSHEGAITEPVEPFFQCMVVDIRPAPGSKNYYFYQNKHGQVVFCITPDPPLYPMTPDGSPLVGWNRDVKGLLHATGMCGQGLMLAPGIAEVIARMIAGKTNASDKIILNEFSPYRKFKKEEVLK
jgi:sarcosine oxidase subunit beta